jgi:hypothetical protein
MDPRQKWNSYQPEQRRFFVVVVVLIIACLIVGFFLGRDLLSKPGQSIPEQAVSVQELSEQATAQRASEIEELAKVEQINRPKRGLAWLGKPESEQILLQGSVIPWKTTLLYADKDSPDPSSVFNFQTAVVTLLNQSQQKINQSRQSMINLPAIKKPAPLLNTTGYIVIDQAYVFTEDKIITIQLGPQNGDLSPAQITKQLTQALTKLQF